MGSIVPSALCENVGKPSVLCEAFPNNLWESAFFADFHQVWHFPQRFAPAEKMSAPGSSIKDDWAWGRCLAWRFFGVSINPALSWVGEMEWEKIDESSRLLSRGN